MPGIPGTDSSFEAVAMFVCETALQEQRRQKRLQQEAGSDDKLSANLAFVKALLETGASDESELNWSALPYPRAQLRWKILRGDRKAVSPYRNLGFQQVMMHAHIVVVDTIQTRVDTPQQ